MKFRQFLSFLLLFPSAIQAVPLPEAREVVTEYHGVSVSDHYRYFEEKGNKEVDEWSRALSEETLEKLAEMPDRKKIGDLIDAAYSIQGDRVGWIAQPSEEDYYFLMRREGDPVELLFHQKSGGEPELIFDPRKIVDGGDSIATVKHFSISPNQKHLAVAITAGGSENASLYVVDLGTGKVVEGPFARARWGQAEWLPDSSGFFYTRLQQLGADADPLETFQRSKVHFHRLGSAEKEDRVVFGIGVNDSVDVDPEDLVFMKPLSDSGWVVAQNSTGVSADYICHIARLDDVLSGTDRWRQVCDRSDLVGTGMGGTLDLHGDSLYMLTRKDAPNGRIVKMDLNAAEFGKMETVYLAPSGVIRDFLGGADGLYVRVLDAGPSRLVRLPWDAMDQPETIGIPEEGRISLIGNIGAYQKPEQVGFFLDAWTRPSRILLVKSGEKDAELSSLPQVSQPEICDNLVSLSTVMSGHDGVKIPVSIIHRKDLDRDKTHPVMLIAYGAYGMSIEPRFYESDAALFEMGGIKVVAHVRGGGELGDDWRLAGYQKTKPNTWKDLISVAEGLVKEGYTTPGQICIHGRSAGGITVGRALSEKPEAFGAVLIGVGLLDTVRAEVTPNGIPNIPEFGSTKTKEGFEALLEMSAYHHVEDGVKYPPVMLYHGANDTRVELWMSQKMTARLLAAGGDDADVLMRIDYNSGHGSGASKQQGIDLYADLLGYFFNHCK